jgi:hypothetical protein
VKFETNEEFLKDFKALSKREKPQFLDMVRKINKAYEVHLASGGGDRVKWPAALRIKDVENAPGIWEVTWSFAGPDGRATFEFFNADGQLGIRWRRCGNHRIFSYP